MVDDVKMGFLLFFAGTLGPALIGMLTAKLTPEEMEIMQRHYAAWRKK